jgi:hypothetical protein
MAVWLQQSQLEFTGGGSSSTMAPGTAFAI